MAHAMLVGYKDVQSVVGAILGPYQLISLSIGDTVSLMTLEGQQNALQ